LAATRLITYTFTSADGATQSFSAELALPTLRYIPEVQPAPPAWTDLSCHQCPNCPLNEQESPKCPVAVNLVPVLGAFANRMSYEEVDVAVLAESRTLSKHCSLQEGVGSLVGLVMATSGCPILDRLRPMVYTHLPFADTEETTYRAIATYVMAQWVRRKQGKPADWDLEQLARTYEEIHTINKAFAKRIRSMSSLDADVNAVVRLDVFADFIGFMIKQEWWDKIAALFDSYVEGTTPTPRK